MAYFKLNLYEIAEKPTYSKGSTSFYVGINYTFKILKITLFSLEKIKISLSSFEEKIRGTAYF